ncbi:alpha/beta hydrolase-fold protein [Gilvimarinus sp. SDUM040013]|uniref:Alpha/beta hydrolase-fold protein n=1 Tax=Gilvimarinus gilvus TaxID=3058038 RepID=A0ABU4S5Y4_9GAMM|nr:alpha/beta hydrolase-fold protein [Gilvimarinus sp. SDUM040013]MDO3387186.1 alpha/beta hydrolase-fold protein [Gilvimarinus sp. SDUM040013]MDX6850749.1 alpha/beta hydrolase-fold protein [Gilvimarinus sp. SDUM040013]
MRTVFWVLVLVCTLCNGARAESGWRVETFTLQSTYLRENKLNLALERVIWVWLPPGYDASDKRYPVIHYIHNYAWTARQMHEVEHIGDVFQRALERGKTNEFIFVVGDYRATHTPGTFCGNNSVVGNWWDYTADELVSAVDERYRTLPDKDSRGLAGDFTGGYCAMRVAMERPGVFSSVYALHPVGTGTASGDEELISYPNWLELNTATSYDFLASTDGFTQAFLLMAQSHAPDLANPPFFANFMVKLKDGELVQDPEAIDQVRRNFMMANRIEQSVPALMQLRGLMFDWGRKDPNFGHVKGNRELTRTLDEYDVPHFSEEYRGSEWSEKWIEHGRVEDRMLPFFKRFLVSGQ